MKWVDSRMSRTVVVLLVGGLAASLALAGTSPAQTKTVKIGALLSLSGPLAEAGREVKEGVELAVAEVNQKGGIKSLGGAPLEVAYGDSQAKPEVAASETERLISRDQVVAIIDMYPSVTTLSATQVAERLKTPFYVAISFADSITERGFSYTFEQEPKAANVGKFQIDFLDYLVKSAGAKLARIAILHEDTDYGQSVARGAENVLKQRGYQIVGKFGYPFRTTDVSTLMAKIKAAKPDAIVQASYIGDSILIARTAERVGLAVPIIDASGKAHPSYIEAVGKTGEGEFVLNMWNKDMPGAKGLNDRYRARARKDMTGHAALVYQGVLVIKEALERAGAADRQALRDALAKIEITPGPNLILPYQSIKFDPHGVNVGGAFIMTQILGGDFVTVWPEKYASRRPQLKP